MTVARQSAAFPENALWHEGPVTFVTVHTVGSDNNAGRLRVRAPQRRQHRLAPMRLRRREAATAPAWSIISHANPGFPPDATSRSTKTGFKSYLGALRPKSRPGAGRSSMSTATPTPSGSTSRRCSASTPPNFTRVEVFGPSDEHWVRSTSTRRPPALFHVRSR